MSKLNKKQKNIIISLIFLAIILGLVGYIMYGGTSEQEPQNVSTVSQVDSTQPASQIIAAQESFSKYNAAVTQNNLSAELDKEVTIFIPNNQAFDSLPETDKITETLDETIAGYHIVRGVFIAADLSNGQKLPTAAGQELVVLVEDDTTYVVDAKGNKAQILSPDLKTASGVIHEIDIVFLPQ